jgi:hypothetical protein
MRRSKIVLSLALIWCCATVSQAGWLSQSVTAEWYVPDTVTLLESHNVVVGPGVELPFGSIVNGGSLAIDLSDTQVEFDFNNLAIWSTATFNGWKFIDTPATPNIVGVSLGPMSGGVAGLTAGDLSFTANSVLANFSGVTVAGAGDFYTINVEFAPEPTSLLPWSVALAVLTTLAWRRARMGV